MQIRELANTFFAAYRSHDVATMVDLFEADGLVEYVPLEMRGTASKEGKGVWGALIDAFPDLTNVVSRMYASDAEGYATVEVVIGGRQAKEFMGIASQGRSFRLEHAFIITCGSDGKISRMTAYWDNLKLLKELGGQVPT
ncbi:nuclear transport factor 2 family protein [Dyella japonica]|uniref:SnoaL-like domain-containing protein n=1 Tax=Dyella japonica A8 TaxID=1217721 RepID=A0A075K2K6_9GAMM|nr:ester cyclase [Dyella japonica]AIF48130.1 hypothetical protein HY57_13095 [Dyella japonica A8]